MTLMLAGLALAGGTHVAMVIDRSCSMESNDGGMNAVLAPAILADLATEADRVEVFPQERGCVTMGANLFSSGSLLLDARKPSAFKESLLQLPSDSAWQPAFESAVASLERYSGVFDKRLFLIVYDGDRPPCDAARFEDNVRRLAHIGTEAFVLGTGSQVRGTELMSAFGKDHAYATNDTGEVLAAYADIFRRSFGARKLPQGKAPRSFSVDVDAGAVEAWLVVAAEADVSHVESVSGNPSAKRVTEDVHDGWNITTRNGRRGYQVVHLDAPTAGKWRFEATTGASEVSWLLLQRFDVKLSVAVRTQPVVNMPSPVEVRLQGEVPSGEVKVTATVRGHVVEGVPQPDGSWLLDVPFDLPGEETLTVNAVSDTIDVSRTQLVTVEKADKGFDCSGVQGVVVQHGTPVDVSAAYRAGPAAVAPSEAWVEFDDVRYPLRDDGADPDPTAGDDVFSARFVASRLGIVEIPFVAVIEGRSYACRGSLDVRGWVQLQARSPTALELGPCGGDPTPGPGLDGCLECGACTGTLATIDLGGTRASGAFSLNVGVDADLPPGLSLHVADADRARIRPDSPITLTATSDGGTLPLLVCANRCPQGGSATANVVLEADGGPQFGPQRVVVPLAIEVHPSSFWTCWGRWVLTGVVTTVSAFVGFGFLRPLRFPKPTSSNTHGFPTHMATVAAANLDTLPDEYKVLDDFAPVTTWYRDERLFVRGDRTIVRSERGAPVVLELTLRRVDGLPVTWIRSREGKLWRTAWVDGMSRLPSAITAYEEVPEAGEALKRNAVYVRHATKDVFRFK